MKTFLVTGATGYIGQRVLSALRASGFNALGIDIQRTDLVLDLTVGFDLPSSVFEGDTHLIHLAANLPGRKPKKQMLKEASRISTNLAAQANNFESILIMSSWAVYSRTPAEGEQIVGPWEAYGESKLEMESTLSKAAKNLMILRPGTILGPGRRGGIVSMVRLMAMGIPLPLPRAGKVIHPFVHVEDVIEAVITWASRGTPLDRRIEILDLVATNPESLFGAISKIRKRAPKIIWAPDFVFKLIGSDRFPLFGISRWHFGALLYNFRENLKQEASTNHSMVETIKSTLE